MKKDIDVKCYELTLTPNYVSDWTFNDALREINPEWHRPRGTG